MRKCIHGKVKPCHICKHDYDRAAPYVVDDPPESLQRCYAVIERLQTKNVGLESALTEIHNYCAAYERINDYGTLEDMAHEALNPTSAGEKR